MPSYSNEILASKMDSLKELMEEVHLRTDGKLQSIDEKISAINGRVRKLEVFKFTLGGALIMLNIIAVPIIVTFLKERILG